MFLLKGHCHRLFILAAAVLVCGAGRAPEGGGQGGGAGGTVLRLQTLPSPVSTDISAQVSRVIVQEFAALYPQYKLEAFAFPGIEGMAMDQGPLMAIATGVPPHGMYVNFRQSSSYIDHGFLVPLEILLARLNSADPRARAADAAGNWLADPSPAEVEEALAMLRARIVDAAWPVLYREADTDRAGVPRGKHVWALPYGQLVRALLYRKDVFNEAGLDPERPPRDWNEFLDYSRKIRALPGKFGFMYSTGIHVSWGVYSFMVSNGVRYMEKGADGRWRAAFNTPAAAETIYYLLELTRQPFETEAGETLSGAVFAPLGGGQEMDLKWQRGEIGMRCSYLTFGRGLDINPALVGIAPAPASYSGMSASELNCGSTGVFAGSPPAQQLGVMRFIWFQTGELAERIRTRMFIDAGYGTFLDPEVLAKYGYDDILAQVPEDWKNTVRDALRNGVPEPYGKNTQTIY
ncbi:MAG: extracellular solute-binding protein, partial [Lentisphaerae bacterium]|nr:extracellular solute-binding protein [Lentisphaerota bacterium]